MARSTWIVALSLLGACAPATFGDQDLRRPDDPLAGILDGPPPACPIDPDCHIGGDCSLYECPDHWECQDRDGTEVCVNPGPDYPDDGSDGRWTCEDVGEVTTCRRPGGDVPDDGGDGVWSCERSGEFVECQSDTPSYPDDGSDGPWSCRFEAEFRVCERDTPDNPDDGREYCVGDACSVPACEEHLRGSLDVSDDRDGDDDGEIYAFGNGERDQACATLRVNVTGYYEVFDEYIAESCSSQLDETGFLTIENSCNPAGDPVETNVGDHFVVGDVDNTMSCTSDTDCGGGTVCREGNRGSCCVPAEPVFMGTFLLQAGVDNVLCLNHWCPVWRNGRRSDGFVNDGCDSSINSIHLRLDATTFVCATERELPAGCE